MLEKFVLSEATILTTTKKKFYQKVLAALWTISVLLGTNTKLNFNHALDKLRTKDDFNFANFLF